MRDVLFVDDLVECYLKAVERIDVAHGESYNIGGGPRNAMSLMELIEHLESLIGTSIRPRYADWRPGDQKVFVSDIRKAKRDLDWEPRVRKEEGVKKLLEWVVENRAVLQELVLPWGTRAIRVGEDRG